MHILHCHLWGRMLCGVGDRGSARILAEMAGSLQAKKDGYPLDSAGFGLNDKRRIIAVSNLFAFQAH